MSSTKLNNGIALEFIDLCIDNYNNGGHSSTKEQEHRYYELKNRIDNNWAIVKELKFVAEIRGDEDLFKILSTTHHSNGSGVKK